MEVQEPKSRIFIFSHPPSASSLLKKMLEKHPQLHVLDDSFNMAYTLGPEKLERRDRGDACDSESRRKMSREETYQKAFDRLHKSMTRAEQEGRRPLFIEDAYMIFRPDVTSANTQHDLSLTAIPTPVIMTSKTMPTNFRCPLRASRSPQSSNSPLFTATFPIFHPITEGLGIHTIESRPPNTNPTVLPDAFLKSMTPICLIRHPARTFPSLYRGARPTHNVYGSEFPINASIRWCKLLVDWYTVATGTRAIVFDGDNLIHESSTIAKVCRALSLDESGVQNSWDAMLREEIGEQDAMTSAMNATIQTSNEEDRSRKRDDEIDIDEEARGWGKEFGLDVAEAIKALVAGAMDDYLYLRQYAIN
ncbi:MAG: hypothetical protein ALECFALPRED_007789 [Alectoria fallacina]|uniref:P-loop containing nucleoside triphosphate hydrolase protein n=1 Tax=Alectoria fallacina TaxID=1903189 RepID=A0A8H3EV49_9LECA|nr:MAG: hypothetical protein ALECFALPRED_007789 [Alectoria fallacina]